MKNLYMQDLFVYQQLKLMKDEVNLLIKLEVLIQANDSEWAAPSFRTPQKDNTICFV